MTPKGHYYCTKNLLKLLIPIANPDIVTKYIDPTIIDLILFITFLPNIIILYKNIYIIDKFIYF